MDLVLTAVALVAVIVLITVLRVNAVSPSSSAQRSSV